MSPLHLDGTNQLIFWAQINMIGDRYSAWDYRRKESSLGSLLSRPLCPDSTIRSILNQSTELYYHLKRTAVDLHTYLLPAHN